MFIPSNQLQSLLKLIKKDALQRGTRVLILASTDCDSLTAALIFITLLQQEYITYVLKPVTSYEQLIEARNELFVEGETNSLVLINCGGSVDILELLSLPENDLVVYIFDSHLPYHEKNIENTETVLLFNGDHEENASEDTQAASDAMSIDDTDASQSEDERNARKARHSGYGTFFGKPAARMMYDLAVHANKTSPDLLWLAIVGVTSHYIQGQMNEYYYNQEIQYFREEVSSRTASQSNSQSQDIIDPNIEQKITFLYDFKFPLYRHWNLFNSMFYCKYVSTRLGTWKEAGKKKLKTVLLKTGIPLEESCNNWSCMNVEVKKTVKNKLQQVAADNEFELPSIVFKTFQKNIGFRLQVSAADVVLSTLALLECHGVTNPKSFWFALDSLYSKPDLIDDGIQRAILIEQEILSQATSLIEKQLVVKSGPFRYAFINGYNNTLGGADSNSAPFCNPFSLYRLAHFLAEAIHEFGKAKKNKPLVVACLNETSNTYLVVGLMTSASEYSRHIKKNKFGIAFEQAAARTNTVVKHHYFDAAVVEILRDHMKKFIEYLHAGLFRQ